MILAILLSVLAFLAVVPVHAQTGIIVRQFSSVFQNVETHSNVGPSLLLPGDKCNVGATRDGVSTLHSYFLLELVVM